MYTIKPRGFSGEMEFLGTSLDNAIENTIHQAKLYGFADLLKHGECLYTALNLEGEIEVKLIEHK